MIETTTITKTRKEEFEGVSVNISYSHIEGESPTEIVANFNHQYKLGDEDMNASYNGNFNIERKSLHHQLYEGKIGAYLPVLTAIGAVFEEINQLCNN